MRFSFRGRAAIALPFILGSLAASHAHSAVTAPMFQSHMVLQRQMAVPVFGTAAAGEEVTVDFRGQSKSTKAAANGRWMVKLDPMEAGGPFAMTIKGANTLALENVMVGEVWLASGQSNMARTLQGATGPNIDSGKAARITPIRSISMTSQAKWAVCTTSTALNFSAVAYYFGKDLHLALGVPVGLISGAVGGTPVERWMDVPSLLADTALAKDTTRNDLYRKWIQPVQPFAIRGVIWYQGESNATSSQSYEKRFGSLIGGWRKAWGQGDFPFHFVQLANYKPLQTAPGDTSRFAEVREAQRKCLQIRNTAMAVTVDIGDAGDIHPVNKWDVGRRLALPARYAVYGRRQDSARSGPMYDTCFRRGATVRVRFDHAHGGLVARASDTLKGFALAGADGKWAWATAAVRGDTVLLAAAGIDAPAKVRYAYASNPIGNLFNGTGLPASPFEEPVVAEKPSGLLASRREAPRQGGILDVTGIPEGSFDLLGRSARPAVLRIVR